MAPCISATLAPLGRSSSERAICFLVRGGYRRLGAAARPLIAAAGADFGVRRDFLAIIVSMVLTPRQLRGVATAPSPGSRATGAWCSGCPTSPCRRRPSAGGRRMPASTTIAIVARDTVADFGVTQRSVRRDRCCREVPPRARISARRRHHRGQLPAAGPPGLRSERHDGHRQRAHRPERRPPLPPDNGAGPTREQRWPGARQGR